MDARARRWARVSVGAGAVVLLLAVVSALLPQPRPCGDLPDRYPPIIAFELARDGRDLVALFGPPGACRDRMVAAMDTANVVDLAAFLPAYALFLAAWFACRRGAAPRAARLGAAIVVGAALADVREQMDELVYPAATALKQFGQPEPLSVYGHDFVIGVQVTLAPNVAPGTLVISARLRYQACNDTVCFRPLTEAVPWIVEVVPAGTAVTPQHQAVFAGIAFGKGIKPPPRTAEAAPAAPAPARP